MTPRDRNRKSKSPGPRKSGMLVRLHDEEKQRIAQASKRTGMPRETWVRFIALREADKLAA